MKMRKINNYKKLLESIIIDKGIKSDILEIIDSFEFLGNIKIEGNALYGKIKNKSRYLEIINNDLYNFSCNYTQQYSDYIINIVQTSLKGGSTKINKTKRLKYNTPNNENHINIVEEEKIYDINKKLIYKSITETNDFYDSFDNSKLIYNNDSHFDNNFTMRKYWYLENDCIIQYHLSKKFMNDNGGLIEKYLICPKPNNDGFINYPNFINLDKELFVLFMTGKMTIEEVIIQNRIKESKKQLSKIK